MTNLEVIEKAYRHAQLLGLGQTLSADDAAFGLQALEAMLMSLPALSRSLTRTRISAATHTMEENQRVFNSVGGTIPITYPEAISDPGSDEADTGGERPPVNGAVGAVAGATYTVEVYVEMLGGWQQINSLTLTGTFPLGPEHELGASYLLAVELAPSYGANIAPLVLAGAVEGRRHIDARFAQDMTASIEPALLRRGWFDIQRDL